MYIITVILSIFKFSTKFRTRILAQIVENREARICKPFLGHGDSFRKVMTKTRSGRSGKTYTAKLGYILVLLYWYLNSLALLFWPLSLRLDLVFVIFFFRKNCFIVLSLVLELLFVF